MPVPFILVAVILVVAMLASAARKAVGAAASVAMRDRLRVPPRLWTLIGFLETAAAVGICAGFGVPSLGFAAAVGVMLLMGGAIVAHHRADLTGRPLVPPVVLATVAILTAVGFATT